MKRPGPLSSGQVREEHKAQVLVFRVRDRSGPRSDVSVPVRYAGAVPDPFRAAREVTVTVRRGGGAFVGQRDSLVTKCRSTSGDGRSEGR